MSAIITWFRTHASAILATLVTVSKAGLLGKVAITLGSAIGTVLGVN